MRNWALTCAALAACAVPFLAGGASAATITYTFTGDGSGTLDGTAFDGDFTVTMVSDTSTVTSGGGELRTTTFVAGTLVDTISSAVLIENTAAPGYMGFGQTISPYPDESLTASVFETYNLINALGLTSGGLSVAPATYQTVGGTLDFESITALSFEATGGVPEASTSAMMLLGFAGLGFLGYRQTAKARVAA
jgi:hypothetical protein